MIRFSVFYNFDVNWFSLFRILKLLYNRKVYEMIFSGTNGIVLYAQSHSVVSSPYDGNFTK